MATGGHLESTIAKYQVNVEAAKAAANAIVPIIQKWGGEYITRILFSGSLAKGTAVSIATDADLFISLTSTTSNTLSEAYSTLYNAFALNGYEPRKQNVSIGIKSNGYSIDLVPAIRQGQYGNDHSLYRSKAGTWTKTNVDTHISMVTSSNRQNEIKLVKIWRNLNGLSFPSIYIELLTIEALSYARYGEYDTNLAKIFNYIYDNIETKAFTDPANTNNRISDDITLLEKKALKAGARKALDAQYWSEVVW